MTLHLGAIDVGDAARIGANRIPTAYVGTTRIAPPFDPANLVAWYDETTHEGANVWRNKTNNAAWDLTNVGGAPALQLTTINGLAALQNTGDGRIRPASAQLVAPNMTIVIVMRLDRLNYDTSSEFVMDGFSGGSGRPVLIHGPVGPNDEGRIRFSRINDGGVGPREINRPFVLMLSRSTAASATRMRYSGYTERVINDTNTDDMRMFSLFSASDNTRFSRATVCEILIFDAQVSLARRDAIEAHLVSKWGVDFPITKFFSPTAWYSDSDLPFAGSVTAWANNEQATGGAAYDLAEAGTAGGFSIFNHTDRKSLNSTGLGRMDTASAFTISAPYSIFAVVRAASNAGQMMWTDSRGGTTRLLGFYDGSVPEWATQRDSLTSVWAIPGGDTARRVLSLGYTSSGNNLSRVGGHSQVLNGTTTAADSSNAMRLFSDSSGNRQWIGRILEVLFYFPRLTDPQTQEIEAYLRTKWAGV